MLVLNQVTQQKPRSLGVRQRSNYGFLAREPAGGRSGAPQILRPDLGSFSRQPKAIICNNFLKKATCLKVADGQGPARFDTLLEVPQVAQQRQLRSPRSQVVQVHPCPLWRQPGVSHDSFILTFSQIECMRTQPAHICPCLHQCQPGSTTPYLHLISSYDTSTHPLYQPVR